MRRYSRTTLLLAALLASLAGYVDAVGFLELGGFFVSFMSGNSTRLGVGLGEQAWATAAMAGGLIALFVTGVVAGVLAGPEGWRWRRPVVLAIVAALLAAAAASWSLGGPVAVFVAPAMGAINAVFQRDGDIGIGVTYMTGALVRMGQRIAAAIRGGPVWDFAPFLLLWISLTAGAVLGAASQLRLGGGALVIAAAACAFVAIALAVRDRRA